MKLSMISSNEILSGEFWHEKCTRNCCLNVDSHFTQIGLGLQSRLSGQIMHKLSIGLSGSKIEYFQRKDPDGWSDISRISSEKLSDHLAHEL